MALGVALPEALDGEENDRAFVVDPDSEIEDEGSSDEELEAFDGMVPRALRYLVQSSSRSWSWSWRSWSWSSWPLPGC